LAELPGGYTARDGWTARGGWHDPQAQRRWSLLSLERRETGRTQEAMRARRLGDTVDELRARRAGQLAELVADAQTSFPPPGLLRYRPGSMAQVSQRGKFAQARRFAGF